MTMQTSQYESHGQETAGPTQRNTPKFLPAVLNEWSSHTTRPGLEQRTERMLQLADRHEVGLGLCGYRPAGREIDFYQGSKWDCVVMPIAQDPAFQLRGRFVMPAEVHEHLSRVKRAGIDFDDIYVAHELPKGVYRPGRPIPVEMLLPARATRWVEGSRELVTNTDMAAGKLAAGLTTMLTGVLSLGKIAAVRSTSLLALTVAATGKAAATAAAAGAAVAPVLLDPVLFGVLHDDPSPHHQTEAAWFHICNWRWPDPLALLEDESK